MRNMVIISLVSLIVLTGISDNVKPLIENNSEDKFNITCDGFSPGDELSVQNTLMLTIKNLITSNSYRINLDNYRCIPVTEVEISVCGNLSFIIGNSWRGEKITILDLEEAEVKETILCYSPVVSNNRKKIVYTSYIPRFSRNSQTVVFVILSFEQGKAQKFVIYPEDNIKDQNPRPWAYSETDKLDTLSPLTWSDDDNHLVFIEKKGDKTSLAHIDLSKGLDKPQISRKPINVKDFADYEAIKYHYEEQGIPKPKRILFNVDKITWIDKKTVKVKLSEQLFWKTDEHIFNLTNVDSNLSLK